MEETVHLLIMYTMLVLSVLLFHKGRKHPQSLILAVYALVEVITNGLNSFTLATRFESFSRFPFSHFIYKPIYCLWVPLFYFYFKFSYSADFRLRKKHWLHFMPFISFLVLFLMIWITKGNSFIRETLYLKNSFLNQTTIAVDITVRIQYIFYNMLMITALLSAEKERKAPKMTDQHAVTDIRWLRFIVYGYAVGCLGGIVVFISQMVYNPATPTINMVSISYFFLFFFIIFYHTISHKLTGDDAKIKAKPQPDTGMYQLMNRIEELVAGKQMYLDADLNLQQIAAALNEKERNISQAINTLQHRNLNDYINSLRVEHACHLLMADKEKPVFEVMYESGFNTKGAFNLAFKKVTGKTPTQFKEEKSTD